MKSDSATVLPPSRGSRKAGAFAPSAKADVRAAEAAGFRASGFAAARFAVSGFAAGAFDAAAARAADFAGPGDFNCFDGALCDAFDALEPAFAAGLVAILPDLLAAIRRAFERGVFAGVAD